MLIVETYLAPDRHGGTGLFAKNFIKKDTVIWKHDPLCDRFYSIEQYHSLHPVFKAIVSHYGYRERVGSRDGVVLGQDNDRFMNHSDIPNTTYKYDPPADTTEFDSQYSFCIASADINAGKEITMDYRAMLLPEVPPDTYKGVITCVDFLLRR